MRGIGEAHPPCLTTGDTDAVEIDVVDLVEDVVAALPTEPSSCGNGVIDDGEQCDTTLEPVCAAGGRSGCYPAGAPNECRCCTLTGETGLVDPSGVGLNECCSGVGPVPAGPGAYFCP